jgi:2-polyprenyl-6-methoxyphenol hydroxylase-like FAD-dependent oxidoreductase
MKAIIVGAGIGGTSAALALRRAGIEAASFEQAPQLSRYGGGFTIWINGIRAAQSIGLGEHIEAIGHAMEVWQAVTWRGRLLVEWPIGELGRKLGAPVLGVSRPALHNMFVEALDSDVIVLGARCTEFRQDEDGVTAIFDGGREEHGDIVIGADGYQSVIRAQLLGPEEPRYAGYTVWRASLDFDHERAPHGHFRLHWGRGARFLFFYLGGGQLYWAALVKAPPGGLDPEGGHKAAVLEHFRGFVEPVEAMIEATDERSIVRQDVYDRHPAKRWGEGRATLLGDAAHPMSPDQGQGANQAIEDAVVLAQCLSADGDIAAALRAYEQRRMTRTAGFVKNSRTIASLGLRRAPVFCGIRDWTTQVLNPLFWRQLQKQMDVEF